VSHASASGVVISAVYGGGGNSGATYTHDYIELFNAGSNLVNLNGWSVQYADADSVPHYAWEKTNLPDIQLWPGQYFLARQDRGAGGSERPPKDAQGPSSIAGDGGVMVALVRTRVSIDDTTTPYNDPDISPHVEDTFGAGAFAETFEGSPKAGVLNNMQAWVRKDNGCQDTNNSSNDWDPATAYKNARSRSSLRNPCDAIELVSNGGFENGSTDWTLSPKARIKCDGAGHGSDCALQLQPRGIAKQSDMFDDALGATPTAAGDILQINASIRSKLATTQTVVTVTVEYVSPTAGKKGNGKDKFKLPANKAGGYRLYGKQFKLDDAITNGKIVVRYGLSSEKLRVDNVSVLFISTDSSRSSVLPLPGAPGEQNVPGQQSAPNGVLPPPPAPAD
jgi:hypothetical protein